MRATTLALALVMCAGLSCSGGRSGPGLVTGTDERSSDVRAAEVVGEVCTPVCEGKECGPDGCGGTCGTCAVAAETCTEAGQCQPTSCGSSKDCPGDLVCAVELGQCVECVGDEDCAPGTTCGADHACHESHPCTSDKDCKPYGQLCDKDAGQCVECLESKECLPEEYCLDSFCVEDVCVPGESRCDGNGVLECREDGGLEELVLTCPEGAYCEDATCKPYLCDGGQVWCDGDVLKVCSADGRSVESETDCAAKQEICFDGKCQACLCKPGTATCVDDSTAAVCSDGCLDQVDSSCEAGQSCLDGECQAWLCDPEVAFCTGDVAKTCSADGLSIVSEDDCAKNQQICLDGHCESFVCPPFSTTCLDPGTLKHCSQDGMSFEPEPCTGTYCKEGQCVPYACQPGAALCDGTVATHCDAWGSGLAPGGTDCAEAESCCVDGQCVEVGPETCDGKDNDCDGQIDEGVLSPCGDCNPGCQQSTAGPGGDESFDVGGGDAYGVKLDDQGFLVTDLGKVIPANLWVANSGEGTVSKIDTTEVAETGRYKVCSDPSRTAVDLQGNVYVGCRGDGGVAKILANPAHCPDKNGDGVIDTSTGTTVLPKGQDECVAYITYPGGSCARAVGVDRDNNVWVGDWNAQTLKKLNGKDGAVLKTVSLSCNPYGLVVGPDGTVWISGRGCDKLIRVIPDTGQVTHISPVSGNLYGITVDSLGRVWLGHYSNYGISMYDPATGMWKWLTSNLGGRCPRGMAGSTDGYMYSGIGCGGDHWVARVDIETLEVSMIDIGAGSKTTVGVALDAYGALWAVNYSASTATRIDPATQTTTAEIAVGANPYTYSDMTGYVLHNFTAPDLNPFFIHQFSTAGEAGATWLSVKIQATSSGACQPMSVLVRKVVDGAPLPWTPVAENVPISTAEFPLAGLPAGTKAIEVKLVLPYQSGGCKFAVEGVSATWTVP